MHSHSDPPTSRRSFLKTTAALGGALASPLAFPSITAGAPNSDKLRIGLIGCGGRGTGAAGQALNADSHVELVALGDSFEERLQKSLEILHKQAPDKVNVLPSKRFVGFDAYQKVIDSGIDVVLLAAPGGFRPLHLKAAVEAGKHIFCEKPMAVDGPGIRSVLESVAVAKKKQLALRAGFCFRFENSLRETYAHIHNGAIGDIKAIYASRLGGTLSSKFSGERQPGWGDLEWQLRNWSNFTWLSGDWLLEVAVHSIDKMQWAMKDITPLNAVASGGRAVPGFGNIFDHFNVVYEYPNQVRGFLGSRHQDRAYSEHADYLMGSEGLCLIGRRTVPEISGKTNWRYTGQKNDMYQTEHDELFASIRAGNPVNDGDWMAKSTLMGIMGRMAAYTGQQITWEMALNSQENLMPPKLDWDMKLPVPPIAIPGVTKYV